MAGGVASVTGQDRATDCGDYGSTTDVHFRRLTKGTLLLEEEQLRLLPKFLSHDGRPQASVYTRRLSGRLMRACVCGSFHSRGEVEHSVKRQKVALKEKKPFPPWPPRIMQASAGVFFFLAKRLAKQKAGLLLQVPRARRFDSPARFGRRVATLAPARAIGRRRLAFLGADDSGGRCFGFLLPFTCGVPPTSLIIITAFSVALASPRASLLPPLILSLVKEPMAVFARKVSAHRVAAGAGSALFDG